MFSNREKLNMLQCFIVCNKNSVRAAERYQRFYENRRQPSLPTFNNLYQNLRQFGSFTKPKRDEGVINEDMQINVLAYVDQNPSTSTRQIAAEVGVSQSTVMRILKKHKFHAYKLRVGQTLHPGDHDLRIAFCNWFINMTQQNPEFHNQILWTDETKFTNCGMFNRHNEHLWMQENPRRLRERRPQRKFGFNVWCGIIGSRILGPFIYDENLTGNRYLHFLQNEFEDMLDGLDLETRRNLRWFQHDGAPPHNQLQVREHLNQLFPNSWIGRNAPVPWSPRSPDLSILDFFLFGVLKDLIYQRTYATKEELRDAVVNAFRNLDGRKIRKAVNSIVKRCRMCVNNNGGHFEHLLR